MLVLPKQHNRNWTTRNGSAHKPDIYTPVLPGFLLKIALYRVLKMQRRRDFCFKTRTNFLSSLIIFYRGGGRLCRTPASTTGKTWRSETGPSSDPDMCDQISIFFINELAVPDGGTSATASGQRPRCPAHCHDTTNAQIHPNLLMHQPGPTDVEFEHAIMQRGRILKISPAEYKDVLVKKIWISLAFFPLGNLHEPSLLTLIDAPTAVENGTCKASRRGVDSCLHSLYSFHAVFKDLHFDGIDERLVRHTKINLRIFADKY